MTLITGIKNFKGGVAETTTLINLATILKRRKGRVLMIDTDSHGNIVVPDKAK